MKKSLFFVTIIFVVLFGHSSNAAEPGKNRPDLSEKMKDSIVYLEISKQSYNLTEPWKRRSISESWACACAVGEYQVITTAKCVANHKFLKVLRHGQNDFVGAKLAVVDYEANLCLIQLDPNELKTPLKPLTFHEEYQKGAEVNCYWIPSDNRVYNARGYLDQANVQTTGTSHAQYLCYVVTGASQRTEAGEIYCVDSKPIGIACWSNPDNEIGLIPSETINRFLGSIEDGSYEGFGKVGFKITELLNPVTRSFLKMPEDLENGVYVTDVYNLGTGCRTINRDDVILKIDGNVINSYGRFTHPKYGSLYFDYLITSKSAGDDISFELWRDGKKTELKTNVRGFKASEMLIPFHEFDRQPEYIVTAGFVLQKLTYEYLMEFGHDIAGEAPSHLYHYYRDLAFKPTDQRSDVIVLSYVIPTPNNLGYTGLGQMVVSKINGVAISSLKDIPAAQKLNPESAYDVIEFELDSPVVVIGREHIQADNIFVQQNYGITKLFNINN